MYGEHYKKTLTKLSSRSLFISNKKKNVSFYTVNLISFLNCIMFEQRCNVSLKIIHIFHMIYVHNSILYYTPITTVILCGRN